MSTSATEKALAVVAIDAIVLAACVTSQAPSFTFALIVAITPALLAGTLLGWLAGTLRRGRFAILALTALATLAVTALLAGSATLAVYGCLPLLASMSLLERWTRPLEGLSRFRSRASGARTSRTSPSPSFSVRPSLR